MGGARELGREGGGEGSGEGDTAESGMPEGTVGNVKKND